MNNVLYDVDKIEIMDQTAIIGQALRSIMKSRAVNKRDLANKTGLSANTINNLLRGNNSNTQSLLTMLSALGYNLQDFAAELGTISDPMPKSRALERDKESDSPQLNIPAATAAIQQGTISKDQMAMRLGLDPSDLDDVAKVWTTSPTR